jgi:hypothetical protein
MSFATRLENSALFDASFSPSVWNQLDVYK